MDSSGTRTAVLQVDGMTCDDCARHVTAALEGAGAGQVSVSWRAGQARFSWPEEVGEENLRTAVTAAGYRPGALRPAAEVSRSPAAAGTAGTDFDLVVLGAGSAAFAAAITATEAGYRVALAEEGVLGGTCVNVGCVPSKALLRAGELAWAAGHHPFAGLAVSSGPVDLAALVAQKDALVGELRQKKYADLATAYGFEVLPGRARFTSPDAVDVSGRQVRAGRYIIATGASPAAPPVPGLAEAGYLTSTTALELKQVPRRLAVIGANAVGLELGQFFLHAGAQVTFLDAADRIAPFEEPEVSAALARALADQGAVIHAGAQVLGVRRDGGQARVTAQVNGRQLTITAEEILVAAGRRPNTAGLGLDTAGVTAGPRGEVTVDEELRTANPRVYAAGDVTGAPQFVYVSAYQGALTARNALLGRHEHVDLAGLPRVIFTAPQVAAAGLTEAQARADGHDVAVSVLPLDAVPRALVNHDTRGVIKLVAEQASGRLLGASVVADGAGDVIQSAVLAIRHGITTDELAATFHPYLTMAEGIKLAAQGFSRDVSKLSCCAA
jgi:mercuric reductase